CSTPDAVLVLIRPTNVWSTAASLAISRSLHCESSSTSRPRHSLLLVAFVEEPACEREVLIGERFVAALVTLSRLLVEPRTCEHDLRRAHTHRRGRCLVAQHREQRAHCRLQRSPETSACELDALSPNSGECGSELGDSGPPSYSLRVDLEQPSDTQPAASLGEHGHCTRLSLAQTGQDVDVAARCVGCFALGLFSDLSRHHPSFPSIKRAPKCCSMSLAIRC